MFNMGFTEMLAIAVIALIVIGPKQLPQLAKTIGRLLGQFKRLSSDFQREIYRAEDSVKKNFHEIEEQIDLSNLATFELSDDGSMNLKTPDPKSAHTAQENQEIKPEKKEET